MRRVAVFGNAGGGKSTLARRLATRTGLPLFPLDLIQYKPGGGRVPHEDYLRLHAEVLARDEWVIDGYGCTASSWNRFDRADTLVFVDLSLARHRWWVTKRLLTGLFRTPEGWPDGAPMWRSTLDSYKVTGLCHRHLTPRYRRLVTEEAASKRVHHLRSPAEIAAFLDALGRAGGAGVTPVPPTPGR